MKKLLWFSWVLVLLSSYHLVVSAAETCEADKTWVNNPVLKDAVKNGRDANFCDVQRYVWEGFLATVAPAEGVQAEFENWMPYYGIFREGGETPVPWGENPPIPSKACSNEKEINQQLQREENLSFIPENFFHGIFKNQEGKVFSDLIGQAGSMQQLLDQNGNIVYYGMRVNKPMYDFMTTCELYHKACQQTTPSNERHNLFFPPKATEIKTAWKQLTEEEANSKRFFMVEGTIQEPDTKKCHIVQFGLVGFHFVPTTKGHWEMLWATFEHVDNAPLCSERTTAKAPGGKWSFYDPEKCGADCQVNTYQGEHTPPQVCMEFELGAGKTPAKTKTNIETIKQLNASVHSLLPADSVWQHYKLVGTIYTKQGIVPPERQAQTGSVYLSNTTMETFTQCGVVMPIGVKPGECAQHVDKLISKNISCFSCHTYSSSLKGAPFEMSHLLKHADPKNTQGCPQQGTPPKSTLPKACLAKYFPPAH